MGARGRGVRDRAVPADHGAARAGGPAARRLVGARPHVVLRAGEHRRAAARPADAAVRRAGRRVGHPVAAGPDGRAAARRRHHPRRRPRAADRQRLRLLPLQPQRHGPDDAGVGSGVRRAGAGRRGRPARPLARAGAPAVRPGRRARRGPAGGGDDEHRAARRRRGAARRGHGLLHRGPDDHPAGGDQRVGVHAVLRAARPPAGRPARGHVPGRVRQRADPRRAVALRPRRLGPDAAGAGRRAARRVAAEHGGSDRRRRATGRRRRRHVAGVVRPVRAAPGPARAHRLQPRLRGPGPGGRPGTGDRHGAVLPRRRGDRAPRAAAAGGAAPRRGHYAGGRPARPGAPRGVPAAPALGPVDRAAARRRPGRRRPGLAAAAPDAARTGLAAGRGRCDRATGRRVLAAPRRDPRGTGRAARASRPCSATSWRSGGRCGGGSGW